MWVCTGGRGGDEEESIAEDDKDHTISSSSSSESESLAHLVLGEGGDSMSNDEEGEEVEVKEVDMMVCY